MKIGFDKVYCVSYCRNIQRQKNVRKLMEYLGIDFTFIYGADYSNLKILNSKEFVFMPGIEDKNNKYGNFNVYTHFIGASYDHYTAVMHAYASRANSVLIMEDDPAFINDVNYIEYALNNYPKDADAVKFGYLDTEGLKENKNLDFTKKNQYFIDNAADGMCFAGCQLYGLCNRETMKRYIEHQEKYFECCDNLCGRSSNKVYGLIKPLVLDWFRIRSHKNNEEEIKEYGLLETINNIEY